jgi:hypothetical protein
MRKILKIFFRSSQTVANRMKISERFSPSTCWDLSDNVACFAFYYLYYCSSNFTTFILSLSISSIICVASILYENYEWMNLFALKIFLYFILKQTLSTNIICAIIGNELNWPKVRFSCSSTMSGGSGGGREEKKNQFSQFSTRTQRIEFWSLSISLSLSLSRSYHLLWNLISKIHNTINLRAK